MKKSGLVWASGMLLAASLGAGMARADMAKTVTLPDGSKTQEGAAVENGKWSLPEGSPTYHVNKDGTVDWYTWSGYRRYHSECHVCHGPDAEGSTYAPRLADSLKTMSYQDFLSVVASGKIEAKGGTDFVMPAFGDNKNVMCYIEDLYVYIKARADGALPRGKPPGRDDAPQQFKDAEKACVGS